MGLCVIEGGGSSSSTEFAKEKWAESNIAFVEKDFNLGSGNDRTVSCSMSDVLPTGKTLLFAVISAANGSRGGGATISSVSGTNVVVSVGYSYSENVSISIRGYYATSQVPFSINSASHEYDTRTQVVSAGRIDLDWFTLDTVLPTDAVIVGYGFKKLNNRTGTLYINGITNRTPIVNIGSSYNEGVKFTVEAYYI